MRDRRVQIVDDRYTIVGGGLPDGQVIITDVEGWFEPEAELSLVDRIGDGGFIDRARWKPRTIVVRGWTFELDAPGLRDHLRELAVICHPRAGGVIKISDEGVTLSAACHRSGRLKQSHHRPDGRIEWELVLVAPDPHLYGESRTYQVSTPSADYGLDWPLFVNGDVLTWGSGTDTTLAAEVRNMGNATAFPVVTVHGDFPAGFRIESGGGAVEFRLPVTPAAPVTIDYAGHAATVGGAAQSWALTRRGFAGIPPGGVVKPVLRAVTTGAGYADYTIRDTYL